MQQKTKIG